MKRILILSILMTTLYNLEAQTLAVDNVSNNLPCLEKNFNVKVVMTVDSAMRQPLLTEEQVEQLLEDASHYFSPICMSFSSCSYDVLPNYSYSQLTRIQRRQEMAIVYHHPRRITLFVVNELHDGLCGYSNLGGLNTRNRAQIFLSRSCADGLAEQFAHHMGTLLGLLDTHHDLGSELADGSNCATHGDRICDTPADPFGMSIDDQQDISDIPLDSLLDIFIHECAFVWEGRDDNEDFYNPNTTNMMSPYPCKCAFTREQFLKMIENYDSTPHLKY